MGKEGREGGGGWGRERERERERERQTGRHTDRERHTGKIIEGWRKRPRYGRGGSEGRRGG